MRASGSALGAESESPPVVSATEGQCNNVAAIARSLYETSRTDGKRETLVTVPRPAIEGAIAALIAALDWADGDADLEPNGDDEPEEGL